ncbi:H+-glucitol symporter [Paenibacillus oralis]|uniref:H+-glucitol symporter n=1 Tax=Paenibacillus oralis TaxID=2490856 RepID=A0A3P3U7Z4_9BACL|nr:glycoside-pentoside-hexuronide (GPH):cation symporter [Paenibacillus oralis]RRJ64603.1 H+-glucitol symporter [Paenibacillus oralis]
MAQIDSVILADSGEQEDRKLKFSEKLAVVINGCFGTFHLQVVQLFILFFYTDIMKINSAYVAGLFLITRIVDAFLTPAFGILIDRTTTPWGKYKPWLIAGGLLTGIFGWFTYTNFNLGPTGNLIYATVTYFLYSLVFNLGSAPNTAMIPAVTKRIDDRASIGQIAFFLSIIGALAAQIGVQPLYKVLGQGNDAAGFSWIMGMIAVISLVIAFYQQRTIKERYIVQAPAKGKGPALKEMLVAVFTNKTAVIVYLYVFAMHLANGIRSGASIYYFKYYFHNDNLLTITGLVAILPTMLGVGLSTVVSKKLKIKKLLIISSIVNIVSMFMVMFIPSSATGVNLYIVFLVLLSFFTGLATPAQGTMLPAAMDYTEWKTKMNINAFMGSLQGFLTTFATALSGSITAGVLAVVGYVGGAAEQSSTSLFGLKLLVGVVPAVIFLLTLGVAFFDLTEEKQKQITKELAERRKTL